MDTALRLLIVDDNTSLRKSMRLLLSSPEIEIVGEAGNGSIAVEATQQLAPDAVLMDYHMPVMNGIEAAQLMLAGPHPPVIILLSGDIEPALHTIALQFGVHMVLQKGITFNSIRQALLAVRQSITAPYRLAA